MGSRVSPLVSGTSTFYYLFAGAAVEEWQHIQRGHLPFVPLIPYFDHSEPATSAESAWRAYPCYGRSGARTPKKMDHMLHLYRSCQDLGNTTLIQQRLDNLSYMSQVNSGALSRLETLLRYRVV